MVVVSGNSKLRSVTVCTLDRKNPKPKPTTEKPVAPRRRGDAEKTKDKSSRKGAFRKAGVEEQGMIDLSWREIVRKNKISRCCHCIVILIFSPRLRTSAVRLFFGFGRQCCNRDGPTTEKPVAPRRRGDAEKTKDKSLRKGAFRKAGVEEQGVIDLSWREICEKKQDFEVLSLHSDFDFFSASPHLRGAIVFGFGRQCCNRSGLAVSLD
jgi:hypothetical protein